MAAWLCPICNYVYDEAAGDPGNGIAPGTPFNQLPAGWECPLCGAPQSDFVLQE